MEIVLALLRTLVFVVATVAATVYVGRRIGRGRPLLWTGTTLLTLYWLVLFGWTSYLTGNANPSPDLSIWVGWGGHLLPFFAALAYIWGIGQSAGFPSRAGAGVGAGAGAGATLGQGGAEDATPAQPGTSAPAASGRGAAAPAVTGDQPASPSQSSGTAARQPFPAPHAVPVVTTPPPTSPASTNEGKDDKPGPARA